MVDPAVDGLHIFATNALSAQCHSSQEKIATAMRVAFGRHWFGHYMLEKAGKGETAQALFASM